MLGIIKYITGVFYSLIIINLFLKGLEKEAISLITLMIITIIINFLQKDKNEERSI